MLALIALSWTSWLDRQADEVTVSNLKQALAVLALARTFNGVISVAQGTEVAIQPVGVGVTLTLGEVLDPLNDLIEQFSTLALLASVSLGLQITLSKITSSIWISGLFTLVAIIYLITLWLTRAQSSARLKSIGHALGMALFLRFILAIVLLATYGLDTLFLQRMQDEATASLSLTSNSLQAINQQSTADSTETESLFDRTAEGLSQLLNSTRQSLDIQEQLDDVQSRAESSVEEIINLIVVFLLQTLLIPIATLYLCGWLLRKYWAHVATP